MFPLNSNDQYIDENGKRSSLGTLFEGSEHDIDELEETVSGHTTQIGSLQTKTGALQDQISKDEYSAESDYTAGDYVIHNNKLYKCNTTCTADTWANNSEYFTETSVSDELATLDSDLSELNSNIRSLSQRKQLKCIDIQDTQPLNIDYLTNNAVNYTNLISAVAFTPQNAIVLLYRHPSTGQMYARVVDAGTNTPVTDTCQVSVYYWS